MKILVAVDGSDVSLKAVAGLIEHVRWFRDPPQLHLLYVHLPIPIGLVQKHVSQDLIDRYYREEGEEALRAARQRLEAAHIPSEIHVHVGDPAQAIVKLARQFGCELICMGTHGRGAVANAVLGSVATKVLHLADRPVLFAR